MTRKSLLQLGAFFLAAIGCISAIFGIIAIQEMWIKLAALISAVICALAGIIVYLRGRAYDSAIEALLRHLRKLPASPEMGVIRQVESSSEMYICI